MGELATARKIVDRYVKDGFQLTSASMVDRLTEVIVDLEKDKVALSEGLGDSRGHSRLRPRSILREQRAGAPSDVSRC